MCPVPLVLGRVSLPTRVSIVSQFRTHRSINGQSTTRLRVSGVGPLADRKRRVQAETARIEPCEMVYIEDAPDVESCKLS